MSVQLVPAIWEAGTFRLWQGVLVMAETRNTLRGRMMAAPLTDSSIVSETDPLLRKTVVFSTFSENSLL